MKRISILTLLLLSLFLGNLGAASADSTHVVRNGDTLSGIAAIYGSSITAIAQANGIVNPNAIYVGQYLAIPGQGGGDAPAAPAVPAPAGGQHVVQSGDTLYRLAWSYNTSIQALVAANSLTNANALYVGQVLNLPGVISAETPPTPPAEQPAPTPDAQPQPTSAPSTATTTHIVQYGESLSGIARRYNVFTYEIVDANNLTSANLIYAGQALVIPGNDAPAQPTPIPTATPEPLPTGPWPTAEPTVAIVPTWPAEPTVAIIPTWTPEPTAAVTLPPTLAPVTPTPEPVVLITDGVATGANLLRNSSFEGGHYNHNGIAELQVPNEWRIEWKEGESGFDQPFFAPEIRVLSKAFLPPHEHPIFIYDGDFTIKAFKGYAPIDFTFLQDIQMEPGVYEFSINVFPDMVVGYGDNGKTYAGDPSSGEVRLIANGTDSGWQQPRFGDRNTMTYRFQVDGSSMVTVGANMRGRYGLLSNGFFMDNWSLRAVR